MTWFRVTTAETVYETYLVKADSEDEAREKIQDDQLRPKLPSFPAGSNDDIEVIDIERTI